MLRFLTGEELRHYPRLSDTMISDRAKQFRERLGWSVEVDGKGWERDDYDSLNPTYVIWQTPDGRHGGSMRFLPTLGRTMVNDHFSTLAGGRRFAHPKVWECTRFCLAENMRGGALSGTDAWRCTAWRRVRSGPRGGRL